MDPNASIRRLCLGLDDHVSLNDVFESEGQWDGSEFRDTADSGKKKETKAFTFYRMETEEVSERYITPYFVSGLHAYDGEINLEYEKLLLDYEEKDEEKFYSDEGPSLTVKKPLTQVEVSREDMEKDIYERILLLQKPRPINETLKFSDQHKKLLDSVLLDKLKLDGEVELGEEASTKDIIRSYKAIKEKNDPGVFVLPIHIEAKFDFHALADTGSNINVQPYR
ncbi:hypothetical protein Tco_1512745, partial [Tanacetum coccineum]